MDAPTAVSLCHQFDSLGFDEENKGEGLAVGYGICAICMEGIVIQEAALVKACDDLTLLLDSELCSVTCILRWATYTEHPSCPQCKNPFESLSVHRSLDGSINDYMFEESVCLLLRATWFVPLGVVSSEEIPEEPEDLYPYFYEGLDDDDDDEMDDALYFNSSPSTMRIGNRRWGDSGYVRGGRKEACPTSRESNAWSSRDHNNNKKMDKKEEPTKDVKGRRAKRAMKREAADKAAAAKHAECLRRFGPK